MGRRRFSEEYKLEAVNLVLVQGLSVGQAADDLGLGKSTLDNWVRAQRQRIATGTVPTPAELEELKRLRKENRILREERTILKKAAAYFATDSQRSVRSS